MKTAVLAVPFLMVVGLIVHVQGSFSGFTIWNVLPVAAGFGALLFARRSRRPAAIACIAFAISVTLFIGLFHLAWLFDWDRTATGSSTSALAFIFVPFWACAFASFVAAIAWGISLVICRCHGSAAR
jgi:hypothetical protein